MSDDASGHLQVVLVNALGMPARARGLAKWLAGVAPRRARGQVTIALVGDGAMRRLNRRYLGKDRPTDVLSFPRSVGEALGPARQRTLGEIAIATGVARRQAIEAGHSYSTELRVLALHGLLHLLGHDHEADDGRMARLEARLGRRGGLNAGVIQRARRA